MGLLILLALGAALALAAAGLLVACLLLRPPRRTLAYALARRLPTDPSQRGWSGRDLLFTLPDRTQTPGWLIQGRNPQGPVFIVSHGWGESRFDALPRAAPLLELAGAVVVYDLRGHGESTARLCRLGAREARDLLTILDQLETRIDSLPGPRSYVLAGFSMGAAISIHAAALDQRQRIRAVVAESPCRRTWQGVLSLLRFWKWPVWPVALGAAVLTWPWIGAALWYDRAWQARRLRCLLLVFQIPDDPICPSAAGRAIAQAAPQSQLFQFDPPPSTSASSPRNGPAARHVSLAECDPQRYFDILRRTLDLSTRGGEDCR